MAGGVNALVVGTNPTGPRYLLQSRDHHLDTLCAISSPQHSADACDHVRVRLSIDRISVSILRERCDGGHLWRAVWIQGGSGFVLLATTATQYPAQRN